MKRELLIATFLLAAGGMLWAGQNGGLNQAIQWLDHWLSHKTEDLANPRTAPIEQSLFDPSGALRSPTESLSIELPKLWSVPDARSFSPDSKSKELLKDLATRLKNSPSFATQVAVQLLWNGEEIKLEGDYAQVGRGTSQARLELRVIDSIEPLTLTKICDGRFLYSIAKQADHQQMELIDLRRIQRALSGRLKDQYVHSADLGTFGEMSMLFQNLGILFNFGAPKFHEIEGQRFCHLIGTWHPESLSKMFGNIVSEHHLQPEIVWHKLPPQIPHQVSLTLTETNSHGWIPQRITFVRFAKPNRLSKTGHSTTEVINPTATVIPIAIIDFFGFSSIEIDPQSLTKIDSSELETIDITDWYLN